jgi:hypothetical protein
VDSVSLPVSLLTFECDEEDLLDDGLVEQDQMLTSFQGDASTPAATRKKPQPSSSLIVTRGASKDSYAIEEVDDDGSDDDAFAPAPHPVAGARRGRLPWTTRGRSTPNSTLPLGHGRGREGGQVCGDGDRGRGGSGDWEDEDLYN